MQLMKNMYAMSIGSRGGRFVYAPCGPAPIHLSNINKKSVFNYCNQVVFKGLDEGNIYTPQAIKNYLQHQFGYNSEEYDKAVKFVDQWYQEQIGVDVPSDVC